MKVLTLIPMFNASAFIGSAIDSVLSQRSANVKVVVVDDCSSDNSIDQVKTYADVTVLRNSQNTGPYRALNLALSHMKGDPSWTHFTFHGADDVSHPDRFSAQLGLFSRGVLATGCLFQRKDYLTGKLYPVNPRTNESQLIFSREVFETIGYYDTNRVGCDTEYKRRLLLARPGCIRSIDRPLVTAYLHGANLTKRVPLGGPERKRYAQLFTKRHEEMKRSRNYYLGQN